MRCFKPWAMPFNPPLDGLASDRAGLCQRLVRQRPEPLGDCGVQRIGRGLADRAAITTASAFRFVVPSLRGTTPKPS